MKTSIGKRLYISSNTSNETSKDAASLQDIRDFHAERLIEQIQKASVIQRRLTRAEHEINRLTKAINNVDTLAKKRGITLQELKDREDS